MRRIIALCLIVCLSLSLSPFVANAEGATNIQMAARIATFVLPHYVGLCYLATRENLKVVGAFTFFVFTIYLVKSKAAGALVAADIEDRQIVERHIPAQRFFSPQTART